MKRNYFIEFRVSGELKSYSKRLIKELKRKFGPIGVTRKRVVPHLTIIKPFKTKYNKILLRETLEVAKRHKPLKVKTKGFGYFDKKTGKVIHVNFSVPKELLNLRNEIAKRLNNKVPDLKEKFIIRRTPDFHLTIAFKEINKKFARIWNYIKKKKNPNIEQMLKRITILVGNKIYREIDLMTKRVLTRREVKKLFV